MDQWLALLILGDLDPYTPTITPRVSLPTRSTKSPFVQYGFSAKVGIDGSHVTIEETSEKSFRVHIPPFSFIGHDDETFKLVAEDNGALSWVTPEIDKVEMINSILSEDAQAEYIADNEETLREQAIFFYSSIITGIDPEIDITYDFRQ